MNFFRGQPVESAAAALARAGFTASEISCEHSFDPSTFSFTRENAERIASACDEHGVGTPQVHFPLISLHPQARDTAADVRDRGCDFTHPDSERAEYDLARAEELLALCPVTGTKVMVVHPGGIRRDDGHGAQALARNVEAFERLCETAACYDVTIAVENMQEGKGWERFGSTVDDLLALIDTVGPDHLGVCFDTSHANVCGMDMPAELRRIGKHLVATHISDNLGAHDDHLLPYGGRIDWPPIVAALKEIGYAGPFNLEIPGESRGSADILDAKARYARELVGLMLA